MAELSAHAGAPPKAVMHPLTVSEQRVSFEGLGRASFNVSGTLRSRMIPPGVRERALSPAAPAPACIAQMLRGSGRYTSTRRLG